MCLYFTVIFCFYWIRELDKRKHSIHRSVVMYARAFCTFALKWWWFILRRQGLLGMLMVNSCTFIGGCRDRFLMRTPYCTLDGRKFWLRIIGMLPALSNTYPINAYIGNIGHTKWNHSTYIFTFGEKKGENKCKFSGCMHAVRTLTNVLKFVSWITRR